MGPDDKNENKGLLLKFYKNSIFFLTWKFLFRFTTIVLEKLLEKLQKLKLFCRTN